MTLAHRTALAVLCLAVLSLSACGEADDAGSTTQVKSATHSKVPADVLARANSTCREFRQEIARIGNGVLADPAFNTLELTTERLVKPSIPLLEQTAARQQALEPAAGNPQFKLYADLFDPVIVLAQRRLSVGRAEDYVQSKQIEEMMTDLGLEQMKAARGAGLDQCDVDFQHVLLSSLSG